MICSCFFAINQVIDYETVRKGGGAYVTQVERSSDGRDEKIRQRR